MAFDWKEVEREDEERNRRATYGLALGHLLGAVAGVVVAAVTGEWDLISLVGLWLLGGIIFLVVLRRRRDRAHRDLGPPRPGGAD